MGLPGWATAWMLGLERGFASTKESGCGWRAQLRPRPAKEAMVYLSYGPMLIRLRWLPRRLRSEQRAQPRLKRMRALRPPLHAVFDRYPGIFAYQGGAAVAAE